MSLRYTKSGHVFISPDDNLETLIDELIATDYLEEFCIALDFSPAFIARLMGAGFLVMSTAIEDAVLVLPKIHITRSILDFQDLHVKKSIRRFLPRYELRVDSDFYYVLWRCVAVHGDGWLTDSLIDSICRIHELRADAVRPVSFALYRSGSGDDFPVAGEFGVMCGRVYTSYSGYYDADNAGTVQLVLTAQYLQNAGFAFFDLGMPLPYKDDLGTHNLDTRHFVERFRAAAACGKVARKSV
jgi:Leu/Phe-tRNA-protein transferase